MQTAGKAMKITFELTAGGKVINGRIYTPKGLHASVDSWTQPYAKPIQLFHDSDKDAIGRIVSVHMEDTQQEALAHLGGDYRALAEVVAAYDTNDAQKIYKVMAKYRLLGDAKWPGLARMMADARITDQTAVCKFQDERYLTLSAGQDFHQVICGRDGQDWKNDGPCEHPPAIMAPGDPENTVLIIPGMDGREVSVVNNPANGTSYVREKVISGSDNILEVFSAVLEDASGIAIGRDAKIELEYEPIGWDQLRLLNPKVVAGLVDTGALLIVGLDQFTGVPDHGFLQSVSDALETSTSEAANAFRALVNTGDEMKPEQIEQLLGLVDRMTALETRMQGLVPADSQAECTACAGKAQLEQDYTQALQTVDSLKTKLEQVLRGLAETKGAQVECDAQTALAKHLEWFDAGAVVPDPVASKDEAIEDQGITNLGADSSVRDGLSQNTPPPGPRDEDLDAYSKFALDRAQKIKASHGLDAAKSYITGQRQYLKATHVDVLYKLIGE